MCACVCKVAIESVCVHVCACACVSVRVCTCVSMCACACVCLHVCMYECVCACVCVCARCAPAHFRCCMRACLFLSQFHLLHNHRLQCQCNANYTILGANQGVRVLHGCLLFLRSFASRSARSALACCRRARSGEEGAGGAGGILCACHFKHKIHFATAPLKT